MAETQTQYFKLDTRDRSFQSQVYYAAWKNALAILFFLNEDGLATVMFVLQIPLVAELRRTVQEGITDVLGFEALAGRPDIQEVDLSRVRDQIDATRLGTILDI